MVEIRTKQLFPFFSSFFFSVLHSLYFTKRVAKDLRVQVIAVLVKMLQGDEKKFPRHDESLTMHNKSALLVHPSLPLPVSFIPDANIAVKAATTSFIIISSRHPKSFTVLKLQVVMMLSPEVCYVNLS